MLGSEISHDFEGDSPDIPDLDISLDPITDEEVAPAIRKLKNGKPAGSDHIQPELLKHAESITLRLANLFNTVWQKQEVPTDFLPKKVICLTVTTGEASPCCQSQAKCLQV